MPLNNGDFSKKIVESCGTKCKDRPCTMAEYNIANCLAAVDDLYNNGNDLTADKISYKSQLEKWKKAI